MAIADTDVLFKRSIKTGSAGNSAASTEATSLGKYISTTQPTTNTSQNIFDNVSAAENAASDVEYRCYFVHNADTDEAMQNAKIWIASQVAGGATVAIGVDPTASSAIGATSAQAVEVADEQTAPAGVTFTTPTDSASALALGTIASGACKAFWIRRTAANTASVAGDGFDWTVSWES